jgi:tetratricopeptide (TPR) repeat protein
MRSILVILIMAMLGSSGEDDGRKANELFRAGQYREAADAYLATLEELGPGAPANVQAALLNNLGAALYRMEDYETAMQAFVRSLAIADTDEDKSRAAYNAGNASFRQNNLEAALSFYKQSLLEDADNEDARYNFEFVRRRVKDSDQQQQQEGGGRIEPSEYAKALKRQAEEMMAARQYRSAHNLMLQGLQIDETVRAFQDFIGRLGNIAEIDEPSQ